MPADNLLSQAGGNAKSVAGSIKENVGGLVSDQWAAEGQFSTRLLHLWSAATVFVVISLALCLQASSSVLKVTLRSRLPRFVNSSSLLCLCVAAFCVSVLPYAYNVRVIGE